MKNILKKLTTLSENAQIILMILAAALSAIMILMLCTPVQ